MNQPAEILVLLSLVGGGLLLVGPSNTQELSSESEYANCMKLARANPEEGFERANAWLGLGGGDAARHCAAVALIQLKQYPKAARRLESLADIVRAPDPFKAQILAQAGQAWLLADKPKRARAVLTAAIKLDETNPNLYIDRAQSAAAQQSLGNATRDLDAALALDPSLTDAWVFRASAHRQTGNNIEAMRDIEKALALEKSHPEGLLERGILRQLQKNDSGARSDWLRVIKLAPASDAAKSARANLEKMDGSSQ